MTFREICIIENYHAHVYFDAVRTDMAQALRSEIEARFEMEMGRLHERPVGPHPCWSYQVAFEPRQFNIIVPWLALNRCELDVLIHPNTGKQLEDHRGHAMWLGESHKLNLEALK